MDRVKQRPTVEQIIHLLQKEQEKLHAQFRVATLGLFGSSIRDEAGAESDVDILVEYASPPTLFEFVRLRTYLSSRLNLQVDLVMKSSLKPKIGTRILAEVIPVWQSDSKKTISETSLSTPSISQTLLTA